MEIIFTINDKRGEMTMVTEKMSEYSKSLREGRRRQRRTSVINHSRQLETQALSERGGGLNKDILPFQSSNDDIALQRSGVCTSAIARGPRYGVIWSVVPESGLLEFSTKCEINVYARVGPD